MNLWCDIEQIKILVREGFKCDVDSIHGYTHWEQVEKNGLLIAQHSGANITVVQLFSWLHDSKREDDGKDPDHGPRAANWIPELQGNYFHLDELNLEKLIMACKEHTLGKISDDPTIGTCWDADRLDLTRISSFPKENLMSTAHGKFLCRD